MAGDVLERAVGEAEVLRDLLLVVGDVLLEQYLVFLLENLDDDCSQELVEGVGVTRYPLTIMAPSRVPVPRGPVPVGA